MKQKKTNTKIMCIMLCMLLIIAALPVSVAIVEKKTSDTLDITTEIYGNNPVKKHIVSLSEEEVMELKIIINVTREKLDNVNNYDETIVIFYDTLASFEEYGLLPNDLNYVRIFEREVMKYSKAKEIFEKTNIKSLSDSNTFCFIAGNTDNTGFTGYVSPILLTLKYLFFNSNFYSFLDFLWYIMIMFEQLFPIGIGQSISFGHQGLEWTYPANGWVFTLGVNGIRAWEGNMLGDIRLGMFDEMIGATGFSGIKINNMLSGEVFYMGFAARVKIIEWPY